METQAQVAVAEPQPEPQDSIPPVKPTPATPRIAQLAKPSAPTTAPAPTIPTVAVEPTTQPVAPKVVAPVANKKPVAPQVEPTAIAKEPGATHGNAAPTAAESQQATSNMMAVSLRWVLQMAGLNVSFADEGRVVRGSDGDKTIEFQVGEREVLVGDHVVVLPSPVTSVGGRAMIPLSFIVEQLGLVLKDPSLMKPQAEANQDH